MPAHTKGQIPPAVPLRHHYRPEPVATPLSDLPFVRKGTRKQRVSFWHVPPTDDYGLACLIGREYGAHFAQYLKDNPGCAGNNVLGQIVADIDFSDNSGVKGYWVGFFSHLERLILGAAQHIDVYADVDSINAFYSNLAAKRAAEKSTEGSAK